MSWFLPPTRPVANPILRNGPETYDDLKVGPCAVVKISSTDYRMFYEAIDTGADPDGGGPKVYAGVGYATSVDGTSWTKQGRIITPLGAASWEDDEVCPNTVAWNPTTELWHLYYHGGNNTGVREIGVMTSPDLVGGGTWTRYGSNPIITAGGAGAWDESGWADLKVIRVAAGDWRAWGVGRNASGVARIGYATSPDGFTWTKYAGNPVIGFGASGAWDDADIQAVSVAMFSTGEFHAYYIGRDTVPGGTTQLGYAVSVDGINWTRSPANPVLGDLAGDDLTDSIEALVDGSIVRLYYGQYDLGAVPVLRGKGYAQAEIILSPRYGAANLLDDANRANTGPPPSASWTNGVSTFTGGLAVVSNAITRGAGGVYRQGSYWNVATFGPAFSTIFKLSAINDTNFDGVALWARLREIAAGTVDGYWLDVTRQTASTAQLTILRTVNATATNLGAGSASMPYAANDHYALTGEGNTLRGWRQASGGPWVLWLSVVDGSPTYSGAGNVGLECTANQSSRIDDFYANTIAAPTNTLAPVAAGGLDVADLVYLSSLGNWLDAASFTFQWQRDNSGGGSFANISGATAERYQLQGADAGCQVRCVVTATNSQGSTSANSNALSVASSGGGAGAPSLRRRPRRAAGLP